MTQRSPFLRSLAVLMLSLTVWSGLFPFTELFLRQAQAVTPTTPAVTSENRNSVEGAPTTSVIPYLKEQSAGQLKLSARTMGIATSNARRLKIDEFDRSQLDALALLAEQFALNPDLAKQYSAGKLPPDIAAKVNAKALENIDPRIIRSIIHLVTPQELGGAGHEFLEISSIVRGHRTEEGKREQEGPTPEGESLKQSPHHDGKAADVTAIDYLRGTEFTIETDKDGKPKVKEKKHLPLKPVTVAWQDPSAATALASTRGGGVPYLNGGMPAQTAEAALQAGVLGGLQAGLDRNGADINLQRLLGHVGAFSNLGQLAAQLGAAYLPTALESSRPLFVGPSGLRQTGQQALSDAVQGQIPAFGFFGDGPDELFINAGRELITRNLGLAEGALIGLSSREVITNAGERFWESRLGDLPLGTLDGINQTDRGDLERHLGRGVLARLLKLEVGSIPLGASPQVVQRSLGLAWSDLEQSGQLLANQLGVPTDDALGLLRSNPDELFRRVGRVTLRPIEVLSNRDDALNLSARPNLIDLAAGSDQERAAAFLDAYAFRSEPRERLERVRAGSETFRNQIASTDEELRAWLLVNAYAPGSDPNQPAMSDRFLAADTGTFYDTGIEVITKGLTLDNTARAALRQYLRSGELNDDAPVDINAMAQTIGFPTRLDFDAVFRADAPAVGFAHVGRLTLARVLATNPETAAPLLATPVMPGADELGTRLGTVQEALKGLRADRSIRADVDKALTAIDGLRGTVGQGLVPASPNLTPEWRRQLASVQRVVQKALQTDPQKARPATVAVNGLFAPAGDFSTTNAVNLTLPGGQASNDLVLASLQGRSAMTDTVELIGGSAFDETHNLPKQTTYDLSKDIAQALKRGGSRAAETVIDRFAGTNAEPLKATVRLLQTSLGQRSGSLTSLDPRQLVRSITGANQRLPLALGGLLLDLGLGTSRPVEQILRDTPGTNATKDAVLDSVGERAIYDVVAGAGSTVSDSDSDSGTTYTNLVYTTASAQTGFPTGPEGPKTPPNPQAYIEQVIGQPLTREVAQRLGMRGTSLQAMEDFIRTWRPDQGPFASRVEAVVRASVPGAGDVLPAGTLPALFDRSMNPKERTKRLEFIAKAHINARLVDPFIAERLNLKGVPSGAILAAKNILLSDAPEPEKSAALKSLGLATADAIAAERFGFPVTWLLDQTLDPKEKARVGLTIASRQLGLDPAVTSLVDTAYQTFFIDGGIDTGTPAGRGQLASLVTAAGAAAKVPPEYAVLAAAFITGDIGQTAVAFAGGRLNQELAKHGIAGVNFTDFYEAVVGPRAATVAGAKASAADKVQQATSAQGSGLLHEFFHANLSERQQAKQEQLMLAGVDLALSKSVGVTGVGGMAHAFLRGTFTDQAAAAGQLISSITRDPTAAIVLGNQALVEDFQSYLTTGNPDDISQISYAMLDSFIGQYADVPIPPGTSEALIGFGSTGDVERLEAVVNPDTLVAFGGGYLDEALGAPPGATAAMYGAYQQMAGAQERLAASLQYDTDITKALNQEYGLNVAVKDSPSTTLARRELAQAEAGFVSLGVNLLMGEQFAKLDGSLGLPSGTVSMLVSTGIYAAMVPGIAIGELLMTTVLPWAAPLVLLAVFGIDLGSLFGGLFGGGDKPEQRITLWSSFPGRFPEEVEYNCLRKGLPKPPDDEKRPKGRSVSLDDFTCEVGEQIVFAKELPPGVFYGAPPQDLARHEQAGQQQAAATNVERLITSLLQTGEALKDQPLMDPIQIRAHTEGQGRNNQTLMDQIWGADGLVGAYANSINERGLSQRKGYLFDAPGKQPFFADHVHWNY